MSLLLAQDPALARPEKPLTSWHSPTPHPQTFVQAVSSTQATLTRLCLTQPLKAGSNATSSRKSALTPCAPPVLCTLR